MANNQYKFYSHHNEGKEFSNFWPAQLDFTEEGLGTFPDTETFFQALKFHPHDMEHFRRVRAATSPAHAKALGQKGQLAKDWDAKRVGVMHRACSAKFSQHTDLGDLLIATGDKELIEDSPHDKVWGCGRDGKGQNLLGKTLMRVRTELRQERAACEARKLRLAKKEQATTTTAGKTKSASPERKSKSKSLSPSPSKSK